MVFCLLYSEFFEYDESQPIRQYHDQRKLPGNITMIGNDPLDLKGQIAFVTGAGQGAGRAIAMALARHNAGGVAVNDFVADRAEAVAAEIRALGVPAIAAQADVGNHASVKAAMETSAQALGPITLLVNNAGNAGPSTTMRTDPLFWETDPADWDRYFHTNLKGVMNCCHIALPAMVAQKKGRIVTVISDAGRVGEARLTAYAAAKAGAAGFVRSIAREGGRFGITCNAISLSTLEPAMEEPMKSEFLASDRARAHVERYVIRRFGQPDDVAHMALFLCSDAASWITGQTYPVNGGYTFAV
jgi:3-oxoacyl-[acyl-carrier protein] reductase